eukprot:GEZU01008327.1.p1 GENE.GEZU01008327.1~~GEZU01008327.1.p1  ORF type:complete len:184 (-),score=71.43 GEZU01008327.1:378-929(-)
MSKIAWPLYKKYGHAYDAFKLAIVEPDKIFGELDIKPSIRENLLEIIQRRLKPQPTKIRADIEITCFEYEGIDAIKAALQAGERLSKENVPIKIKLVAPPLYVMITTALDKNEGIQLLNEAIQVITDEIKKRNGNIKVKVAPRAVSESDDTALTNLMAELTKQNAEVSGDEDSEEEEEEDSDM